jgi:hypothetical protein
LTQQLLNNFKPNTMASAGNNKMFHPKQTRGKPLLFSNVF